MNQKTVDTSVCLEEYKKCGYLYRSPKIKDKHYVILSCLYCSETSLKLDEFLQHLDYVHPAENSSNDLFKEEINEDDVRTSSKTCITKSSSVLEHVKIWCHK